jgi:heat shock protein HtpX
MLATFKTRQLLTLLTLLIIAMGSHICGPAVAINFFSCWFSYRIILRMYNSQELTRTIYPAYGGGLMSLFSTRPPMEERIARLESPATRTY